MARLLDSMGPLAFGGASIAGNGGGYSFGSLSEGESLDLLKEAKSRGVKVFDSAPIYGFGESERRIGKAFSQCREEVFITSKSGITWNDQKRVDMSNDPKVTRLMIEQSLRDLGTDYIDLFMIHWPDAKVDISFSFEVLAKAKLEGKIRHLGLCNTNLEDLEKCKAIDKVQAVQSELNPFNTSNLELFEYLEKENISFQSWGTLDKGILTGSVNKKREQSKDYPEGDCRKNAPWWKQKDILKKVDLVEEITPILKAHGHSSLEWALAHNLQYEIVDQVLVGARTIDQLTSLLKAFNHLPSKEILDKLSSRINKANES